MSEEIRLKVGELTERGDFGRGITRLSAKDMKRLGIAEGDVIEIEGKRKTAAIAVRAYPADVGLDIIRMDGLERRNCGAGIGEPIIIKKADIKEAKSVTIAPARKGIIIHMGGNLLKQNLLMRPVVTGDIIIPNPIVQDRRNQSTLFEQFFGMDFGDFLFTPFGEEKFVVVRTDPKGIVRITRATDVELLPQAAAPIEEERIPEVTYEDLGGLHDEIQKVREMIELPLKHPELFERLGIEPPKGILLHGPPGTGKTLLAKAVANESGAKFHVINGPEVMCVGGETKIFTNPKGHIKAASIFDKNGSTEERGRISIKKLKEPIKTFAIGKDNNITTAMITHVAKLKAPSFNLKLSDGNEVIVSKNQPFLVYESGGLVWKRAEEIQEGDLVARLNRIVLEEKSKDIEVDTIKGIVEHAGTYSIKSRNISRSNFISLPKKTSPDLLEFLGLIVSEGSISKKGDSIVFANKDEKLLQRYRELLTKLFGVADTKEYQNETGVRIATYSKVLVEFLKLLGFAHRTKLSIPGYFYKLPKDEIAAFIRGYFEGDGTVSIMKINGMNYPTPILYSVNKEFLQGLQALLQLKLGISTKLKEHKTPHGLMQKLVVRGYEGRKKFAEIGDGSSKLVKLQQIKNVKRIKEYENIPKPDMLIRAVKKLPYKEFRNHDYYVYGNHRMTKHAMQRLFAIAKKNGIVTEDIQREFNILMKSDIAWETVEQTEPLGEQELYDFTVDKDNFTAAPYLLLHNSKFYGESEENLRKVFELAEKNAPSIIFIDEIDSIAPKREEVRGEVEKRVVSQLLTLLDGLKSRGKIIVIGATNIPNAIDPALRRPGRFDREIELGVPNKDGRKEILQIHTRGMPLTPDVDLNKTAEITYGYVGADISALCKEAAMHALRRVLPDLGAIKEDKPIPQEVLTKLIVANEDFEHALKMVEPSAMREVLIEVPNVRWDDIGGLEGVKASLKEAIEWPLKHPESFKRLGIRPPTGVLLYGPPGCGKTLLAKAVANESGANFIAIKGPELLSMYVGESERHVREVFRRAKQVAPAVIFFDEIDALVPRRGYSQDSSHVSERVVAQLLSEISGLEDMHDIVVIGATNRPDIMDQALLRPGRLDRQILVPTPDERARLEVLKVHTKNMPLKTVDIGRIAKEAESYSGADLEALCREAAMNAMRKTIDSNEVTRRDFDEALRIVKPSVSQEMNEFYESVLKKRKARKMEEDILYTG
ncbi:MAG: AAA family ATPase [Candidatus Aenigmarchaeota archaeon]|nr:AAA family ATPase [Candidatus Aenigmarchaeota archaeon]